MWIEKPTKQESETFSYFRYRIDVNKFIVNYLYDKQIFLFGLCENTNLVRIKSLNMKKLSLLLLLVLFVSTGINLGQSFDWNIRGGLNIMNSKSSDEDVALLYHAGIQAGVRITSFGFYGEAVYSMNEDQNKGGDPVGYFMPALLIKGYWRKLLFIEFGGAYLSKIDDSNSTNIVGEDVLNPDNEIAMLAGLGLHLSKFELSFRSTTKQSYGIIQVTAAIKF